MIVAHFKDRNAALINRQEAKSTQQVKRLDAFVISLICTFILAFLASWRRKRFFASLHVSSLLLRCRF